VEAPGEVMMFVRSLEIISSKAASRFLTTARRYLWRTVNKWNMSGVGDSEGKRGEKEVPLLLDWVPVKV
jgi:hypothetical protein